jgi:Smg-4/UPF3 family
MSTPGEPVRGLTKPKHKDTVSSATPSIEKPKKQQKQRDQHHQDVKLKVIIRGLPPNLPESKFKEVTTEWINDNTVDWYYYVPGKLHERCLLRITK